MADKIFLNARYAFRSDTFNNWQNANPILEKGEPAVVTDGIDGEWLKIGDGITPFNSLEWKKGPKGEQGLQGIKGDKGDKGDAGANGKDGKDAVTDQTYSPTSENAQSGKAVNEALTEFRNSTEFEGRVVDTVSYNGYATTSQVESMFDVLIEKPLGDIETALDNIIAIQRELIGGDSE